MNEWMMFCFYYLVKHSSDGVTTDSDNSRLIAAALLLIYRPQEDERLGLVSWPTADGLPI